jgi:hypothetical protein
MVDLNTTGGYHREIHAVTHGMVKPTADAPWEPAILLLEEPGLSSVVIGISARTGLTYASVYDYRREEWRGCFIVDPDVLRKG